MSESITPKNLILFEDEQLLVVNKPPGINTHSATPYSSEGIYDWLRNRDSKWSSLAIHQRLDCETSGVLLFGRTREANQSLAKQFEDRTIAKRYRLLTDRDPGKLPRTIESSIGKIGGGKFGSTGAPQAKPARTEFNQLEASGGRWMIEARPLTGRTHQIRIHASDAGFPILGDTNYGGSPHARLCLHAHSLKLEHPVTGKVIEFVAPIHFEWEPHIWLRNALWLEDETNTWRLSHGASDGCPGWYVERLGEYLLSQSDSEITQVQRTMTSKWLDELNLKGAYHKILNRRIRQSNPEDASPKLFSGDHAPNRFEIRENGIRYSMSFEEGYSVGLFLDQKDNRNRLLAGHFFPGMETKPNTKSCSTASPQDLESSTRAKPLDGKTVLNTFAYTCGFSVCAAKTGADVTSLDLSKKYLDWGRENFRLNDLDPDRHDFIYGDCFDWMKRLTKKDRQFDIVLLDPPTFSKSKKTGIFKADKHYGRLVTDALKLLAPNGVLFASTNCATLAPEEFLRTIQTAIDGSGRRISDEFYAPQSPDFPTTAAEPPYLKTVWLRVD